MWVNSAFKRFFNLDGYRDRLAVGVGVAIKMLAVFFITTSFTEHSNRDLRAKQVNLIIREIGHRLLLQAGDSTSRVLPVTEIKEGTFLLKVENDFVFNHDSLVMLSQRLLPKTQFPSGYTVTVHECMTASIVYGFQISNNSPDILACRGRSQPPGCYTIEIAFPGFYENVKQKKEEQKKEKQKRAEQKKEEKKRLEEKKAEQKEADIDPLTEEPKSFKVDPQEANPKLEEVKTTIFDYPLINLVYIGMLVLLGVTLLIRRFGKILTPVPVQNQNNTIIKESVPEMSALGKFLFDVKDQRLLLGSEGISLTDKECRILELLNKNFGKLIPRETLMEKVWISEGVITGRSLDMFVSKLRKKLSSDPELRITNVHGKGYKLEIP